jgi:dipeptidyl aminopeptidase/acylaminoacyl peptidase
MRLRWILVVATAAGCVAPPPEKPAAPDRVAIVAAERGPQGARLVSIDEQGDRQFELVQPATTRVRDTHPAISPDAAWIVFTSSRDRALDQTSLWIAPLGVTAAPRRLTQGPAIDAHPTWTPDGAAIVFASTRGGSFDLWRLAVTGGRAGALVQLTRGAGHEVTPAVAPDGTILYAAVTPDEAHRQVETHLEQVASDGTIRRLTEGPADSSPAVSPDGTRLIFARPQLHDGKLDSELWQMVRATGAIAPLVDLPLTDESGPTWSRDGRFVFATSVLRGADERVVFSSVIHVDTRDTPAVARLLEDRVGAIVRMTPAIAAPLDAAALHRDPEYLPELARIMSRMIEAQGAP